MTDSANVVTSRPSGIPVPINKRSSLSFNNTLHQSTSTTGSSRPNSPVILSAPPPGRKSPLGARRPSLLNVSDGRPSAGDSSSDDPVHLKSQIAMLQANLATMHHRMVQMTADLPLDSSTSASPRPLTPVHGLLDLSMTDGTTPLSAFSRLQVPDVEADDDALIDSRTNGNAETSTGRSKIPRLPHSNSSYDLRSSAITPGKTPVVRKTSDGPLGLNRIPQSAVSQGLSLHATPPSASPSSSKRPPSRTRSTASPTPPQEANLRSPFIPDSPCSPLPHSDGRPSPYSRRVSGGGSAASTRVIDALQTDLLHSRGLVEKLKQEVRANQRLIGSLTRQNEDLKDTKERQRVESEGLNNVIARKERLLQEVLERARAAEGSLAQHLATKKALEQSTKKSLQEMESQVNTARVAQQKAERESGSLRDSVKSLKDVWARDLKTVRDDMKRSEEKSRKEVDDASHFELIKLVEAQKADRISLQETAKEAIAKATLVNTAFEDQIAQLRAEITRSAEESDKANTKATELAAELSHLRRLMREPRRASLDNIHDPPDASRS